MLMTVFVVGLNTPSLPLLPLFTWAPKGGRGTRPTVRLGAVRRAAISTAAHRRGEEQVATGSELVADSSQVRWPGGLADDVEARSAAGH